MIACLIVGAGVVIYLLNTHNDEQATPTIQSKDYYDVLLVIDPTNCLVWNEVLIKSNNTKNTFTFHWQKQSFNEFPTYTLKTCTTSSNGTHYGLSVTEVDESQIVSLKELETKFKPKNVTVNDGSI